MKLTIDEIDILLDTHTSQRIRFLGKINDFSDLDKHSCFYDDDKVGHNDYYQAEIDRLSNRISKLIKHKLKVENEN